MKLQLKSFILIVLLLTTGRSWATVEMSLTPPDEGDRIGRELPPVTFINEENQNITISADKRDRPILFVPFYSHCTSACPLNVARLKDVLKDTKDQNYNVVLFSFNPNDTSKDLKDFRRALQVPTSWLTLRSSQKDTNTLLETLDFRYMTEGSDFVHSNVIVVLSPALKIVKFIQGLQYTAKTIDESLRQARPLKNTVFKSLPIVGLLALIAFVISLLYWTRQENRRRTVSVGL